MNIIQLKTKDVSGKMILEISKRTGVPVKDVREIISFQDDCVNKAFKEGMSARMPYLGIFVKKKKKKVDVSKQQDNG